MGAIWENRDRAFPPSRTLLETGSDAVDLLNFTMEKVAAKILPLIFSVSSGIFVQNKRNIVLLSVLEAVIYLVHQWTYSLALWF